MRVLISFMRHGESTTNVAERSGIKGFIEMLRTTDPPLSSRGRIDCLRLRDQINEPDFLFSSPLKRALQTAQLIFPHKQILIAPFLVEIGRDLPQNKPQGKRATEAGNLILFVQWLKNYLKAKVPHREIVHVMVISHSLLMRRDLHLKNKPANNAIVDIWL